MDALVLGLAAAALVVAVYFYWDGRGRPREVRGQPPLDPSKARVLDLRKIFPAP